MAKDEEPITTDDVAETPDVPSEQPDNIVNRSITEEMKANYIDYSMSVIVSRALPDVRDGLKPSQRRILVTLNDLDLTPSAKYRKSAKICGTTSGDYHPHGEMIVYPTMVKMAQDFNMRYMLVDGQGNFGSIDGDPWGAMRYTEARMTKITQAMLSELKKGTVLYVPNYDNSRLEPSVLPSAIPNLLCNGADGIAVGMATKIPPHNLKEVIEALVAMIDRGNTWKGKPIHNSLRHDREKAERVPTTLSETPQDVLDSYVSPTDPERETKLQTLRDSLAVSPTVAADTTTEAEGPTVLYPHFLSNITVEELMEYIPGPDFPTSAAIYDQSETLNAYATGRGRIICRAKAAIVEGANGKFQIIVSEIPYQVNKAHLITKMAELVKNKRLEGISDLRDESNREGIRIVIDLRKGFQPKTVLNKLYKYTEMQKAFNTNMIALVNGQPKMLTLKHILDLFLTHRIEVVIRAFEFELAQARYRGHILEGLTIALDHLDEVIKTIRASKTQEDAKANLITKFDLTDVQAQAILDLPLRRLAALERQKIEDEYTAVVTSIENYEALLSSPDKILKTIRDQLSEIKEKYGDERRTKVYKGKVDDIAEEDMVASETTLITISSSGYIKRMPPATYRQQKRGGKGIIGATTKEGDYIMHAITCNTHDTIVLFTNVGKAFELRAFEIPEFGRSAKGIPLVNLVQLQQDERATALLTRTKEGLHAAEQMADTPAKAQAEMTMPAKYLFMATKFGTVKKTAIDQFGAIRANGLISIKLDPGDELRWVQPSTGDNEIILITKLGRSIRFHEQDVRETGRNTRGVRGIAFRGENDEAIGMEIVRRDTDLLLTISENGSGKMTAVKGYPLQGRAGQGVFTFRVTEKTGPVVVANIMDRTDGEIVVISRQGQVIRSAVKQIPTLGRQTSGVHIMRLNKGDTVSALAQLDFDEGE